MLEASSQKRIKHPLIWPETVDYRLYQKKISEAASEKNSLVILPTALGKTVISAMVVAETLYNYRDSKVLVMAPTRPLIMQHRNSFHHFLKLRKEDTVLMTGKTPPTHRKGLWEGQARIFFSTPQIVRNDLLDHRVSLEDYALLVFDECHRAVGDYAYTDVAEKYAQQAHFPLILGMTASPGSKLERIQEVCRNLYIERVEYRSEEDPDVKPYIHPVKVEWKKVELPPIYEELKARIRSMLNQKLYWLYTKGVIKRQPKYVTRTYLIQAGDNLRYMLEESIEEERAQFFKAIINQSIALTLFHMLVLLETQGLHTLKAFMDKVEREKGEKRSYAIISGSQGYRTVKTMIEQHIMTEHPKAELLHRITKQQVTGNPSSRLLVFTQYRDTASHLVQELNKIPRVRAERFIGQATKTGDKGLTQEEQAKRIQMLKDGDLNVLVATSIAEEGLDIPEVDHVLFYEPIPSGIRTIQRRGRTGRKSPGKVTILAAEKTLDTIYLNVSRRRTQKMRSIAENLNSKLPAIVRKNPKPPANPMSPIELKKLEEEARSVKVEPEILKTEIETVREFSREVERAKRIVYMKLLERGPSGGNMNQVISDMEFETFTPPIIKAAIANMVKEGLVAEVGGSRYSAASAAKSAGKKTYDIQIEKIYRGRAVVRVNDEWRARLTPEEYNGPRQLIKKNSRFRAVADLYRLDGTLCISIKQVTKVLD